MSAPSSPGVTNPNPPHFQPGEEVLTYRRWLAGMPVSDEHARHFDGLRASHRRWLDSVAAQHDEIDQQFRDEITRYAHGYGWHKSLGQLPFDWSDSELTRLRPRDWKQARTVRFHRVTSPRVPKQRVRATTRSREHRPGAARRAGSSSSSSAQDPGSDSSDEPEPPASGRRCAAPWCEHLIYGASQKRYCGTERCNQARAEERQRKHRHGDLSALERDRLTAARLAGMVGSKAFAGPDEHALSFLWKFALVDGSDPGEQEALLNRPACRCNGHHIDGGAVGCFKCGQPRSEVVSCC